MRRAYFDIFYVLAFIIKKINPRQEDILGSACAFLSTCISINVLSIVFLLEHCWHFKVSNAITIIALPIWWLNHKVLMRGNERNIVFHEFELRFQKYKKKKLLLLGAIMYVLFTLGICIYFANINRERVIEKAVVLTKEKKI